MMKSYDKNAFKARVGTQKSVLCSNDLTYGLKLRRPADAIKHKYIQANNDKAIMYLVFDLDHDDPLIFEKVGLPPPNFITMSERGTSHYLYALEHPIFKDYIENAKIIKWFAKIQQAYTEKLKGDCQYVGLVMKNPLNEEWRTWNVNRFYAYDLYELADYVDLPKTIKKKEAIGEGRNCFLFDAVRKFAYKEVLFYKTNGATQTDFYNVILNKLEKLNVFEKSSPLDFNELKSIAKSVAKWTWSKFTLEKGKAIFIAKQKARSHKRKSVKHLQSVRNEVMNEFSKTKP